MTITPFPTTMDDSYIEDIWQILKNAIEEILIKATKSNLNFEDLFGKAYHMVLFRHGEKLYNGIRDAVTQHLKAEVRSDVLASLQTNLLQVLNNAWNHHQISMKMIRSLVMYMDRNYMQKNGLDNIYNLGLIIFTDEVVCYGDIKDHLRDTLVNMVMRERKGEVVDRLAIKNAVQMLLVPGVYSRTVYEEVFESPFLQELNIFYSEEGKRFLAENTASVYIKRVESTILEEVERARNFLDVETEKKIVELIEEQLIIKHKKAIVEMENSGVIFMLKNNKTDDLSCMYSVLSRVSDGIMTLSDTLSFHLREQGKALVAEEEGGTKAIPFVQNLLDLKDSYDHLILHSFDNDIRIKQTISRDFEYFLNLNTKCPEYLSLFIDNKLKKNGITEIEAVLDKAIILFRFLQEKDVFERYYKQHLAKRLLLHKSVMEDSENTMISKLKIECGCQFTSKMEGMFKDMSLSATLNEEFKQSPASQKINLSDAEIHVRVLTTGQWPLHTTNLIANISNCPRMAFDSFIAFYHSKYQGRRITLQTQLGFADLKALFYGPTEGVSDNSGEISSPTSLLTAASIQGQESARKIIGPRKHIIQVTTYQMIILMLFNSRDKITYEEIKSETDITDQDLIRALQALTLGKPAQRILTKNPKTKEIEPSHQFMVNDSFTSKLYRVKIQNIVVKGESEPDRKETRKKVDQDRNQEVEAAIVRIMKAKKRMTHKNLVLEVTEMLQSRFLPIPLVIKKRIESLLERDYLARTSTDRFDEYTYIPSILYIDVSTTVSYRFIKKSASTERSIEYVIDIYLP